VNHLIIVTIYEYAQKDGSETIHLVRQDGLFTDRPATLCGRLLVGDWTIGDETPSGISATCGRCRKLSRPREA
jgi:hypothetical protein